MPSSPTAPATTPPCCTASSATSRYAHPARADLRLDGLRPAGGDRGQARPPGAHGRRLRGRRLLPDDRRRSSPPPSSTALPSSSSSSTTASTAPSACTRSATIRAASSAPTLSIPTSPPSPAPSAADGVDRRDDRRVRSRLRARAEFGQARHHRGQVRSRSASRAPDPLAGSRGCRFQAQSVIGKWA